MELSRINDKEFERICRENRDLRIEQSKEGDVTIMPGNGGLDGIRIFELAGQPGRWDLKYRAGVVQLVNFVCFAKRCEAFAGFVLGEKRTLGYINERTAR